MSSSLIILMSAEKVTPEESLFVGVGLMPPEAEETLVEVNVDANKGT